MKKSIKFKIQVLNGVAIGTLFILTTYGIIHLIAGDRYIFLIYLAFHALTAISILTLNYLKKYSLADYALNILFPIAFIVSSIQLGEQLDIEYYIYLTGVGAIFFGTAMNNKKWVISILNILLFITLKIYIIYQPDGILLINPYISPYFKLFNSVVIFLLLYIIVYIVYDRNIKLLKKLKNLSENQEQIITERTKEIQNKSETLRRYVNELERFSYISAHDLREPLRTIKGISQLLIRDINIGKTEQLSEYSTFIENSIDRLDILTNAIVRYTEIESLVGQQEIVNPKDIINDVIESIEEQIEIQYQLSNLPLIKINAKLGYFLFENIIRNAVEYCDKPIPKISIQVSQTDDFHHFSIQDNGQGVSEEYYELVFEMFKKLQNDLSKKGSGIGLAICKKIIEAYKGKIWMESEVGIGSTVHFSFPKIN